MREIKFRAWDNQKKEMITKDFSITYLGAPHNLFGHLGRNQDLTKSDIGFELMQFTGLKDKNGVGIYEGDIVKENYELYKEKRIGEITISPSQGVLINGFPLWVRGCEIIGNIYENPELLK